MTPTARLHRGTFTATVDVNIDIADLEDSGWHHEDECKNTVPAWIGPALVSLHHQAHPGQPIRLCREDPCRSLTLDHLGQVDG